MLEIIKVNQKSDTLAANQLYFLTNHRNLLL